jgi:uncharacterized cupin superfamily protein
LLPPTREARTIAHVIAHWDDVEAEVVDKGPLGFTTYDLGTAAGTKNVGVTRARVDPGKQSSPVHVELDEEEIFYVLAGSGLSWQDGEVYEIQQGDCVVHRIAEETHTMIGGPDGLDLLIFGERSDPPLTYLPRAKVARVGVTLDVSPGPHPWDREAEAGDLELPPPSPRRENISSLKAEPEEGGAWCELADAAGSARSGLNWIRLDPGRRGPPPHCHSAEEEIFVILDGEGTLELWPTPGTRRIRANFEYEEHPVRAGHVLSRPPGTRIAHSLKAGDAGLTYLVYGTRDTNDVCYYPRSNKIFFRGVGIIARLESLEYSDGEPED